MSAHGVIGPGVDRVAAGRRPAPHDAPRNAPAEPSARPDLRVIGPRDRPAGRRRRVRLAAFAAGMFALVVVFGLVGVHVILAQNQFRLDRLNTEGASQEARYQRLRLQVDQLESPQRIVATAEGKLGMVAPAGVTYLTPSAPVSPAQPAPAASAGSPATTTPPTSPSRAVAAAGSAGAPADWAIVKPQLVAHP